VNYKKPFVVRDFRNGSWFWIQTHIWRDQRLTKSDKIVYGTLASYANDSQRSYPSVETISKDGGLSPRQVHYSFRRLEKFGYVGITRRRGKANYYDLLKTSAKSTPLQPLQRGVQPLQTTCAKKTLRTISNNYNNINKRERVHTQCNYLLNIPLSDIQDLSKGLRVTEEQIRSKAEDLYNYCKAKGKVYKNYKAFLRNVLKKDFPKKGDYSIIPQ